MGKIWMMLMGANAFNIAKNQQTKVDDATNEDKEQIKEKTKMKISVNDKIPSQCSVVNQKNQCGNVSITGGIVSNGQRVELCKHHLIKLIEKGLPPDDEY